MSIKFDPELFNRPTQKWFSMKDSDGCFDPRKAYFVGAKTVALTIFGLNCFRISQLYLKKNDINTLPPKMCLTMLGSAGIYSGFMGTSWFVSIPYIICKTSNDVSKNRNSDGKIKKFLTTLTGYLLAPGIW